MNWPALVMLANDAGVKTRALLTDMHSAAGPLRRQLARSEGRRVECL